jgi:hypothetical protein
LVELLDLQLQVSDQCLVVGLLSPNDCDLGASRDQRRFQRLSSGEASRPAFMLPMES